MDLQFLQQHIVPELQDTNVNDKPILKADAIRAVRPPAFSMGFVKGQTRLDTLLCIFAVV